MNKKEFRTSKLKLGASDQWKQRFYDGYNVVEIQAMAKGLIITSADEVLAHPDLYRYRINDYKTECERFERMGYTNTAYSKGKAVGLNNLRMVQEA